ncbi:MAG: PilZ domain-containing protein [Thermodesulfobacteriota bacterium]
MGSNHTNERRKYPRFEMDLPLEYRVLDAPQAHGGLVINASESGLLVHSIKDIPVGTRLNIAVLFPQGYELANFEVFAEIVWKDICWVENREGYELGLKFIDILKEEHQKLKRLLSEKPET